MALLQNNIAFVTGGAQGIGRGIVLELARAGADVIIGDLNTEMGEAVSSEVRALGCRALFLHFDVTDPVSIKAGVDKTLTEFSVVDILVNNAGVMQKGLDSTPEDFDRCHEVNVKSIWQVTQAFTPGFKRRRQGKIVNIASGSGRQGVAGIAAYSASKAAAINLTQSLAASLGAYNINVNAVCPGVVWTPMWEKLESMMSETDDIDKINERTSFNSLAKKTLLGRTPTPEDIGQAVVFLASSSANNITGQALNVDAGVPLN